MIYKNIRLTTKKETLIPIYYIDDYQNRDIKQIFNEYKFKNARNSPYLLSICMDMCIGLISENKDSNILFTYPPSTMFYRKEKDIDSMGNLMMTTKKYLNFYFRDVENCRFKKMFSINQKYLKHKKAQHIDGNRSSRTKDLNTRYYINFWNKRYLNKIFKQGEKNIICIVDDVSSTGGTLLACKKTLGEYIERYDIEVELYSLAH